MNVVCVEAFFHGLGELLKAGQLGFGHYDMRGCEGPLLIEAPDVEFVDCNNSFDLSQVSIGIGRMVRFTIRLTLSMSCCTSLMSKPVGTLSRRMRPLFLTVQPGQL